MYNNIDQEISSIDKKKGRYNFINNVSNYFLLGSAAVFMLSIPATHYWDKQVKNMTSDLNQQIESANVIKNIILESKYDIDISSIDLVLKDKQRDLSVIKASSEYEKNLAYRNIMVTTFITSLGLLGLSLYVAKSSDKKSEELYSKSYELNIKKQKEVTLEEISKLEKALN
jgi:hypothetical protein